MNGSILQNPAKIYSIFLPMKVSYDVAEFDTNWRWMKSYSKVTTDFYGVLKDYAPR